jgi:hypothetical protein
MANLQQIKNAISSENLINALTEAIKSQIELGDPSISRFNQAIDSIIKDNIKPILDQSKGLMKSSSDGSVSEIKEHFCRGRKWVSIPSEIIENENQIDNPLYHTVIEIARHQGFDHLIELWNSAGFAWVRFHSTKGLLVNFSIHPNSSVGSNIKFSVTQEIAMSLDIMNGTPKSNGYEQKTVKPKIIDLSEEVQENDDSQNDEKPVETVNPETDDEINELLGDENDDLTEI